MIYLEIFWIFFRISVISFGGVFGVLPDLQRIIVGEHHWITAQEFVQSYVVAQFVPGPNMVMCSLIGYRIAGIAGAASATLGIFLGPVLIMGVGCALYYKHREKRWVRRAEIALRPLVFGLILSSSVIFLRQQMGSQWPLGLLIGIPVIWLDWHRKLGAMSCIFLAGVAWWICVNVLSLHV